MLCPLQVKVADFGLARALEAAGSLTGGLGTYQVGCSSAALLCMQGRPVQQAETHAWLCSTWRLRRSRASSTLRRRTCTPLR